MGYNLRCDIIGGDGRGRLEPPTGSLDPLFMPVREGDITLQVSYTVTTDIQSVTNADFVTFSTVDGVEIIWVNSISADIVKDYPENATFVTEYPMENGETIEALATTGSHGLDDQITWTMVNNPLNINIITGEVINSGTPIPISDPQQGRTMEYTFAVGAPAVPPPEPDGRGGPLSYQIKAAVDIGGIPFYDQVIITQDNLDDLRQEYLDVRISNVRADTVPPAYTFTTAAPVDDRTPPNATFENLVNKGVADIDGDDDGVDERHDWWLSGNNLIQNAVALDNAYAGVLNITSGYRCPAGNKRVGGARNSKHIYGKALDYDQGQGVTGSQENWNVWDVAGNLNPAENFIYDQHGHRILFPTVLPWPIPAIFTGTVRLPDGTDDQNHPITEYRKGHVGW